MRLDDYKRTYSEDDESLLSEASYPDIAPSNRRSCRAILGCSWICSLALTALVTYFLTSRSQCQDPFGTFNRGYLTDFRDVRPVVELRHSQFHGSPHFRPNGSEYIPTNSPSMPYIGAGPEVDAAWNALTADRYFLLTDEEARNAWGEGYKQYWNNLRGGYLGGLDMFHTLHCLNHIRMSFYPNTYTLDPLHGQMHQIHCIDHLRQMIQCNADLTVIPTRWFEGIEQSYIDSDQVHTCRDFASIRRWTTERYNGSTAVKPRNPDGSPRDSFYDLRFASHHKQGDQK